MSMQSLTLDQAETLAEAGEAGAMAVSLVEAAALEQQHQLQQQEQEEESEGGLKGDGEEGEDVVSVEQCTGSDVQKASGDHEEKDEVQSPNSTESSLNTISSLDSACTSSSANNNSSSNLYKRAGIRKMRPSFTKPQVPIHHSFPAPLMYGWPPIVPSQYFVSMGPHPYYQYQSNDMMNRQSRGSGGGSEEGLDDEDDDDDDTSALSSTNLYIRDLPTNFTDQDLLDMCEKYGTIKSTKSILEKDSGKCKGYGFVDFIEPHDAQRALDALSANGTCVQFARLQYQDPTNLYLSNLPKYYGEKDIEQLLTPFGKVISSRILREPNGYSRGVGFVRLDSKENCQKAITALNGTKLSGSEQELNIKLADSKRKRPWLDIPDSSTSWLPQDAQFGLYADHCPPPHPPLPTVLPHNGHSSSRVIQQSHALAGSPQYVPQPLPHSFQPAGSSPNPWHNAAAFYYNTPPTSTHQQQQHQNGSTVTTGIAEPMAMRSLTSQLNHLQLSTTTSSSNAPGVSPFGSHPQRSFQFPIFGGGPGTPSTAGSGTGNFVPPTHTIQYTQQPAGMTIMPTTQYLPH